MAKLFKENFLLILLAIVTILTFWDLPKTFYQQDEWQSLGHNLAQGVNIIFKYSPFPQLFLGESRPLSTIFYLIFLGGFKFNVVPITIFAILNHILNIFLVFLLVNRVSKNKCIGLFASSLFALNSVSHQAITWASAVNTLPATTLILLAILFYLKYLDKNRKNFLLLSFLSVILSLFFKETAVFLFIFFPFLYFLYKKNVNITYFIRDHLLLIGYGFLVVSVRFAETFLRTDKVAGFIKGNENFMESVIFHSILYPLTSLFQIFTPPLDLYSITPIITKMQYKFLIGSPLTDLVGQSIVADMISILGSVVILGFLILVTYKYKDKVTKRNILFALAFFFLSFLPYAVLDRDSSYLSSRYFYVGGVAAAVLFGYIIFSLMNLSRYLKWVVLFAIFLYLLHHISVIRGDINYQVRLGHERKTVLNEIKELKPTLDDKTIFYVTGDRNYLGDITNPFQNGLGYILEILYYDTGKIPKDFLTENFLWDLGSEGYRELGNKGFGYFQDLDEMVEEMKRNELKADIVHGFSIRSSDAKVLDITSDIRTRISTVSAIRK